MIFTKFFSSKSDTNGFEKFRCLNDKLLIEMIFTTVKGIIKQRNVPLRKVVKNFERT